MCLCLCVCVCITQFRPTCQKFSLWKRFQTWTKVSVCGSPRPRCAVLFWFNTGRHVRALTSLGYATNGVCCSIFFFLPSSVALIQPTQSSVSKCTSASQTPIQEVTRDCPPPSCPPAQLLHIRTRLGSPLWALITPLQSDDAEVIFCRKLENTRAIFKRAASQSSRKGAAPFPPSEAPRDKSCRASVVPCQRRSSCSVQMRVHGT